MSLLRRSVMVLMLGGAGVAMAQAPAPRFPQPVRVGSLIDRQVLRPVEAQDVLGRVAAVVRRPNGGTGVLLRLGGVLGFGARTVLVPVEAMVLLGEYMEVIDLSPAALRALPTADPAGLQPLAADAVIRVGLARPSH